MYADDTSFIVTDNDLHVLHSKLSQELDHIDNWMKANKLKLNVNKTHVMLFQNRSLMYDLAPVRLGQEIVQRIHTTKFLGVLIDDNLNWKQHIANLCTTLSKTAGIMYRIRHKLTTESMLTLYYTLLLKNYVLYIYLGLHMAIIPRKIIQNSKTYSTYNNI